MKKNIQCLKMLSIFLIILSHIMPYNYKCSGVEYINIQLASLNIDSIILQIIRYFGQIGNVLFVISSAWFLLEKDSINVKKVIKIYFDFILISLICLFIVLLFGFSPSIKDIITNFSLQSMWFIGCYIIFYILSPKINLIINNMKEKEYKFTFYLLVIFALLSFIKPNNYIYSSLIGFIIIYFFVSFVKNNKLENLDNFKLLFINILSVFSLIFFVIILNYFGRNISFLSSKMQYFCNILNPFVLVISFSIFLLFYKSNISSKIMSYCSSDTLFIYLFHDNYLIREYIRPSVFKIAYNFNYNIIVVCLFLSIVTFVISILLSEVYKFCFNKIRIKL